MTQKSCKKHKGMEVSYSQEYKCCPVCQRDQEISRLDLNRRFFSAYSLWSLDYIKVALYQGVDREERQHRIDGIFSKITDPNITEEQIVQLLEEYCLQRKSYSWS